MVRDCTMPELCKLDFLEMRYTLCFTLPSSSHLKRKQKLQSLSYLSHLMLNNILAKYSSQPFLLSILTQPGLKLTRHLPFFLQFLLVFTKGQKYLYFIVYGLMTVLGVFSRVSFSGFSPFFLKQGNEPKGPDRFVWGIVFVDLDSRAQCGQLLLYSLHFHKLTDSTATL